MILRNKKCTAVVDIDEKFVLGADDDNYDIIFNPKNLNERDSYSAVCINSKTNKTIKIAVICEHELEFSAALIGTELNLSINKDIVRFELENGVLIQYENNALNDEFDFSELEKFIDW